MFTYILIVFKLVFFMISEMYVRIIIFNFANCVLFIEFEIFTVYILNCINTSMRLDLKI